MAQKSTSKAWNEERDRLHNLAASSPRGFDAWLVEALVELAERLDRIETKIAAKQKTKKPPRL